MRFIINAKDGTEDGKIDPNEKVNRYTAMRLNLERMNRGKDKILGTKDDIQILADSPIFAVTDSTLRMRYDLPISHDDYDFVTVKVGTKKKGFNSICQFLIRTIPNSFKNLSQLGITISAY